MRQPSRRTGFTLVEMLVVISIISILMAVLLPAIGAARARMQMTQCGNNLRNIGMAVLQYETVHKVFPPGEVHGREGESGYNAWPGGGSHCAWDNKIGMWMNAIYPYLELEVFYDAIDFNANPQWTNAPPSATATYDNKAEMRRFIPVFHCPSDPVRDQLTTAWGRGGETSEPNNQVNMLNYYAVMGSSMKTTEAHPDSASANSDPLCNVGNGVFYNDSQVRMGKLRDGISYTAMLAETWGRVFPAHDPRDVVATGYPTTEKSRGMNGQAYVFFDYPPNSDDPRIPDGMHKIPQAERGFPNRVRSFHADGAHIMLVDGGVRFVNDYIESATAQNMDPGVWQFLATIDEEDIVNPAKLNWRQ